MQYILEFTFFRHKLKFSGLPDSVEKARQAVEDMDKTLRATGPQNAAQDEDSPDCAACFCPIDPGDLYRLEACAHPFCNGCIVRQVWPSAQNRVCRFCLMVVFSWICLYLAVCSRVVSVILRVCLTE